MDTTFPEKTSILGCFALATGPISSSGSMDINLNVFMVFVLNL